MTEVKTAATILRAAEIVKAQSDREAENTLLVAMALQTGYQLGKMAGQQQGKSTGKSTGK